MIAMALLGALLATVITTAIYLGVMFDCRLGERPELRKIGEFWLVLTAGLAALFALLEGLAQ